MQKIPQIYELYRHFSGKLYQVLTLAKHAESGQDIIVYQALFGNYEIYAGDLSWFLGMTSEQISRFQAVKRECQTQQNAVSQKDEYPHQDAAAQKDTYPYQDAAAQKGEYPHQKAAMQKDKYPYQDASMQLDSSSTVGNMEQSQEETIELDPFLIEFLDADNYEAKLNILAALHHRMTDDMLTTMAVSCDLEVGEGDIEERYTSLRSCLQTLEKYESNRLRNR
jgi:hypothetical protein